MKTKETAVVVKEMASLTSILTLTTLTNKEMELILVVID